VKDYCSNRKIWRGRGESGYKLEKGGKREKIKHKPAKKIEKQVTVFKKEKEKWGSVIREKKEVAERQMKSHGGERGKRKRKFPLLQREREGETQCVRRGWGRRKRRMTDKVFRGREEGRGKGRG